MRNTLCLLELLLVECDIVVSCDVLQRLKQVILNMFLALFLLNNDRSLEVQIVYFLEDVEQGWVGASINTDFLEFVPEMILDRLLLELASFQDDVVLPLEHKAVHNEILTLEQICLLKEADNFFGINIVIALLNIHSHEVKRR